MLSGDPDVYSGRFVTSMKRMIVNYLGELGASHIRGQNLSKHVQTSCGRHQIIKCTLRTLKTKFQADTLHSIGNTVAE